METTRRESCKDRVNPARKYIRLQEIGLYLFLSWPVVMMVAAMYHFPYAMIGQISVLMILVAVFLFATGHVGRQELRDKEKE